MTSIIEKRLSLHKRLVNQQQENEQLKYQVVQLQVLANMGTASYMIAHEINNLLTPLANYAALALRNPEDKPLMQKALEKTIQNCTRASKIMESMLAMANTRNQKKEFVKLITLVDEIFTCLCRDFSKDGITVTILISKDLVIWAIPIQIQQVLMNLILNARDAMLSSGGVLAIKATDNNDKVQIEVSDTGVGIEPANLENIFKSFFTTKTNKNVPTERSGSGLGLAFCKQIIDAHNGDISVVSKPSEGSTFKITLTKPQVGDN